ncbi:MAG: polysaccharide deacetylase family protein [Aeromicrobium erythreum]
MLVRHVVRLLLPVIVLVPLLGAAPAQAVIPPDTACGRGTVHLTFDDGPDPRHTRELLRVLRREHAQATFFVVGRRAARHPGLLREMVRDGHAVENHSWDHADLSRLSRHRVRSELGRTDRVVRRATGREPTIFRPPYGATDRGVRAAARRLGLRQELWTVDTRDWSGRSVAGIRRAALKGLRPHRSNVVLLHDGVATSGRTVRAVAPLVRRIRAKGYCLRPLVTTAPYATVTVPDVRVRRPASGETVVAVPVRLDAWSQWSGSVRVRTERGAVTDQVVRPVDERVRFPRGSRGGVVLVRVRSDVPIPGTVTVRLLLQDPRHVHRAHGVARVVVTDPAWPTPTPSLPTTSADVVATP